MRLSAIAEELIARGKEVIFVGQITELVWVEKRVRSQGFSQIYKKQEDFVPDPAIDVLIIDSYEIDTHDSFIAPCNWLHIISIFDKMTPLYNCTLRIHPGFDYTSTSGSISPSLAGPEYIPLRSELSKKTFIRKKFASPLKIVVTAGGSDPYKLVQHISRILQKSDENFFAILFSEFTFDSGLDSRFEIVEIGERLADLSQDADLVFTTASTSSLEFIARGMCIGIACSVDNQQQNYELLGKLGVAAQIGFRNSKNQWIFDENVINTLISSVQIRSELVARTVGLIDFKGSERIVDAILNLEGA
jgi:spore coat polysaccharide biosynthesis predicted glycosyltransferase SpsG